jgi:hypothetical protein
MDDLEASLTGADRDSYARLCARELAAGNQREAEKWARKFAHADLAIHEWAAAKEAALTPEAPEHGRSNT